MTVTVIVDDSDPGIMYDGPWTEVNPQTLNSIEFGITTALGNTLHNSSISVNATSSVFRYNFNGI